MKRHYCSYFDKNYLVRAVALIESLNRHENDFVFFAVCMDEITRVLLEKLNLPNVITVPMHKVEQNAPSLVATKTDRTPVEYYWTAGPTIISYILRQNPQIDLITYLDADMYFFSSPDTIFEELGDNSVLIHEHRFPPSLMGRSVYGRFNVGLLSFKNNPTGLKVLNYWRQCCIEWCYSRLEDGKYGDQKYLEEWPQRFEGVAILKNIAAGLAPWNFIQYHYDIDDNGSLCVDNKPVVFCHFHALEFISPECIVPFHNYPASVEIVTLCYQEYIQALDMAISMVRSIYPHFMFGLSNKEGSIENKTIFAKKDLCRKIEELHIPQVLVKRNGDWDCYCPPELLKEQKAYQSTLSGNVSGEQAPFTDVTYSKRSHFGLFAGNTKNNHLITEAKPMSQSRPPAQAQYDVSIVLGTKDRAQLLDRMLESLKNACNGIKCEVIVIDGNSKDNTLQVLQKHGITRVYSESQCLGPGRHSWGQISNFGFAKARGKWVMYGSDDIIFSKNCLSKAVNALDKQSDEVAAGLFFYRNTNSGPDWDKFGVDFTLGQKLLMNYGIFRLDYFKQVGGLNEQYKFYCSDGDFCYKLYSAGKQFIVLPECLVVHDNILDKHKQENAEAGDKDIALYKENWKHYISVDSPNPRRLLWHEDYIDALNMPMSIERKGPGIEYYWHGLSYFQYGMFDLAHKKFQQAIEAGFDHDLVQWFLKKSEDQYPARQTEYLADEFIRNQNSPSVQNPVIEQTKPPQTQPPKSLDKIIELGLWKPTEPLRLHLGCGKWRFDGYVNIDYPPEEHNVEIEMGADFHADITQLTFDKNSVDEIRLHHVFEHFNRVNALALLIRWHRWLKTGAHLHIETPDIIGSAKTLLSNASWKTKMGVVRHIAGDQASQWGYHIDHWFVERFDHTLKKLGFDSIQAQTTSWQQEPWLSNVEVLAVKTRDVSLQEQLTAADELLWESTVADKEQKTWQVWRQQLRQALEIELAHIPNEETLCRK